MPRAITLEEASDAGQITLEHAGAFTDRLDTAGVPADDLAAALRGFRRIHTVISRGRLFGRAEIERLLAEAQIEAAKT